MLLGALMAFGHLCKPKAIFKLLSITPSILQRFGIMKELEFTGISHQ